jgi:hypothetical protein
MPPINETFEQALLQLYIDRKIMFSEYDYLSEYEYLKSKTGKLQIIENTPTNINNQEI